jgi:hypothetical protein
MPDIRHYKEALTLRIAIMGTQVGTVDGDLGVEGYHDLNNYAIELPQAEPIGLSTVKTSFGVVHWPDVKGKAARKPRGRSLTCSGSTKAPATQYRKPRPIQLSSPNH